MCGWRAGCLVVGWSVHASSSCALPWRDSPLHTLPHPRPLHLNTSVQPSTLQCRRAAGFHNREKNVNASINTIRIEVVPGTPPSYRWAVVCWGEEGHLAGVGALASAFGGGTEG